MPLPITVQQFSSDLDTAKAYFKAATLEGEPQKQQALATLALAAGQIAQAEALWLSSRQ